MRLNKDALKAIDVVGAASSNGITLEAAQAKGSKADALDAVVRKGLVRLDGGKYRVTPLGWPYVGP